MVEIALILNNKAAQSYSDVTFSGSYAKSEGKTGRKVGGVAVMYIQDIHEDELLVKIKIDELHEGKLHVLSDSTYKDTNSDQTVRILQTKFIY